jgi:hypothetical protein
MNQNADSLVSFKSMFKAQVTSFIHISKHSYLFSSLPGYLCSQN